MSFEFKCANPASPETIAELHRKIRKIKPEPYMEGNRYAKKKPTNADRIRAMSDEELAEFFTSTNCCLFEIDDTICSSKLNCNNCAVYIKKWLQSEAKQMKKFLQKEKKL